MNYTPLQDALVWLPVFIVLSAVNIIHPIEWKDVEIDKYSLEIPAGWDEDGGTLFRNIPGNYSRAEGEFCSLSWSKQEVLLKISPSVRHSYDLVFDDGVEDRSVVNSDNVLLFARQLSDGSHMQVYESMEGNGPLQKFYCPDPVEYVAQIAHPDGSVMEIHLFLEQRRLNVVRHLLNSVEVIESE